VRAVVANSFVLSPDASTKEGIKKHKDSHSFLSRKLENLETKRFGTRAAIRSAVVILLPACLPACQPAEGTRGQSVPLIVRPIREKPRKLEKKQRVRIASGREWE
jgi:hypothetical protein